MFEHEEPGSLISKSRRSYVASEGLLGDSWGEALLVVGSGGKREMFSAGGCLS